MDKNVSSADTLKPNIRLKEAREKRGLTQGQLAELIEIHDPMTISRWERGLMRPSPKNRLALAKALDISVDELGLSNFIQHQTPQSQLPVEGIPVGKPFYKMHTPTTSFVGRAGEITRVCTSLKQPDVRIITLLGAGGIGKTRLGIQVAAQVCEHFSDGVCFVGLDSIRDQGLVVATIAKELGIHESGKRPLLELVKRFLHAKKILLLLDSFEHVITAAPVLDQILQACPQVKVLVTSRSILHLQLEHIFTVSPLQPKPAELQELEALIDCAPVELFAQRARIVQPDFTVTLENVQTIVALCKHLDYLPLAIELAASHSRLFSPHALLTRVTRDFHLLYSELHGIPERHQTLSNAVRWSYELLTPDEQWLFRHLAVFSGGVALNTLEDFLNTGVLPTSDVIHTAHSLLNKSLLQQVGSESPNPRVYMLDTTREYGIRRLHDQGELEECQRSHAIYYLHLVKKAMGYLRGAEQDRWLQLLEQEQPNLEAALEWLIRYQETMLALQFVESFGKFCGLRGHWSKERHWLTATLALPNSPESKQIRARVLRRTGYLSYRLGDLEIARELLEESLVISRKCADKQNLAGALVGLGLVLSRQKDTSYADKLLRESVRVARETGDPWTIANALHHLARIIHSQGQPDEAHRLLTESLHLSRRLADKDSTVRILTTLVSMEITQGRLAQAVPYAQEGLELACEFGTLPLIALALSSMSNIACEQKDYMQAKQYLTASITIARAMGDELTVAKRHRKLADIALEEGDLPTISAFVREKSYLQYDIPEMAITLEACRRCIDQQREQGF